MVVPIRWMVASDVTTMSVEMYGTAIDTSRLFVTPYDMNTAERLTSESIELTVVMTSSRPPRNSALSCVKTAGTDCRSMFSIESKASR